MSQRMTQSDTDPSQKSSHKPTNFKKQAKQLPKKPPTSPKCSSKPPAILPNIVKCLKHDTKCEEQSNLEDFVDEIYEIVEPALIQTFNQEEDQGNIEYKHKLIDPTKERLEQLATQMKFRLNEGLGEAYYRLGVEHNGRTTGLTKNDMFESLKTICTVAQKIKADVIILKVSQGIKGKIVELMIRKANIQGAQLEIKALLFGESGSGKSTLLGVLRTGEMDDGKGKARASVSANQFQLTSGTTHSVRHQVIGFDSHGNISNQTLTNTLTDNLLTISTKIVTLIDVGGHKRAQKQLISSLCSFFPEYAILVMSALASKVSTEPIQLACAFNLPMIIVVTHIDVVSEQKMRDTIYNVKLALKQMSVEKVVSVIRTTEDAVLFSQIVASQAIIPIFPVSSVTGENFNILTSFLNLLPPVSDLRNNADLPTEFLISEKFTVQGKLILAGTVIKGNINKAQILHLGPDSKGNFRAAEVLDVRCVRVRVDYARCGQTCTVQINPLTYCKEWLEKEPNAIRKGMVLVESKANPRAAYEFQAELELYPNAQQEVVITRKYQPVINTLTTRQSCIIVVIKPKQEQEELEEFPELNLKKEKSKSICGRRKKLIETPETNNTKQKLSSFKLEPKRSHDFSADKQHKQLQKPKQKMLQKIQQQGVSHHRAKKKQQIIIKPQIPQSIRFRFKYFPQYIKKGQKLIINDGLLKAIGRITDIYY